MASRSLGSLTLDLIARIGGFKSGMDQASRIASQRSREIEGTFSRLGTVFGRVFGAISIGATINKIVEETSDAQRAFAQLNAVVLQTGKVSGLTTDQLVGMSDEIQRTTTFTDEAAQSAATLFVQMGKLSGPQIRQALQASADIAARFGGTLEDAAFQIARATSGSSRGIERLRSIGVLFSREQKELIKNFEKTGQSGKIVELVLNQITKQTQGAAVALRGTLGGSLAGLRNAFDELFELRADQTTGLVDAINLLADNLERIAKVAINAAIAYGTYRAALIAMNVATATAQFVDLFRAIASGRVIVLGAATAEAARATATYNAAVAAGAATKAEVDRTAAMVAGTRATYARIVADEASTATAATRATVIRNAARAEAAYNAAVAAHAPHAAAVATAEAAMLKSRDALNTKTSKLASTFGLLLTPFRGIIAFAATNPFTAIALGITAATVAVVSFADKIKVTEDGVVTLETAAKATFQIIGEELAKLPGLVQQVNDAFFKAFPILNAFKNIAVVGFEFIAEKVKEAEVSLTQFAAAIPALAPIVALMRALEPIMKRIEERARKIAEAEKAAADARAKAAAATGGIVTPEVPASDPQALEKIRDMVTELKKRNTELASGAVAALKYSLAEGELAELFKKAGPDAEKYRQALIDLTEQHEKLEKAAEASKEAEKAREQLKDLIADLQQEIATLEGGASVIFDYRLEHGDLAEALKKSGNSAEEFKNKLVAAHDELQSKKIANQIRDINLQILELQGNTVEAIELRFQIENAELIAELQRTGNVAGQQALATLKDLTLLQAEFNAERERGVVITDELARQEERIRNSQEAGVFTELEAMAQIGEAREDALAQLRAIHAALEQIALAALALGNPQLMEVWKQMGAEIEALASQTNLLAQQIESNLKDSFSSAFQDFVKGSKTAAEAFKDFAKSVIDNILDILAQNLAQSLFGGLSSSAGFGRILDMFPLLRSTSGVPLAGGGPFEAGSAHIVGERGPELAVFGASGTVIPNEALGGVHITTYMDNRGASQDLIRAMPRILDERDRRIVAALRDARSRGKT